MADVGTLVAKLTLDSAGFSKGISEVNGLASGLAGGIGKVLGGVTATVTASVAAATAAVGSLVKASVQGFAEFEQLAGGAQKIFDEIDYKKIEADANGAWETMNLSASQYLSLINTVGASFAATMGDEKGYNVAKQGMQAIADYASGTGRNVEELNQKFAMITRSTSSYQSIADQFSGILPATSNAFLEQAQAAGLLSTSYEKLTDVPIAEYQEAVAAMLEKGVAALNLTGNTAAETRNTVSGSFNGMKAAWENLVVSLSQGGEAFDGALSTLIEAVGNFAEQIIPVISQALQGVSQLIAGLAPVIAAELPGLIATVAPMLLDAAMSIVTTLTAALPELMASIMTSLQAILPQVAETIISLLDILIGTIIPQVITFGAMLISSLAEAFVNNADQLSTSLLSALGRVIEAITTVLPQIVTAGVAIITALAQSFSQNSTMIVGAIVQLLVVILNTIVNNLPQLIIAGLQIILGLVQGIVNNLPLIISAVVQLIATITKTIIENLPQILLLGIKIVAEIAKGIVMAIPQLFIAIGQVLGLVDDTEQHIDEKTTSIVGIVDTGTQDVSFALNGFSYDVKDYTGKVTDDVDKMGEHYEKTFDEMIKASTGFQRSAEDNGKWVKEAEVKITDANGKVIDSFKTTTMEVKNVYDGISTESQKAEKYISDAMEYVAQKSEKAASSVESAVNRMNSAMSSVSGGGAELLIGHRAGGGSVSAGVPYVTGELGPELFIPSTNGYILNHEETEDVLSSRGGITIQINGDVYDNERSMRQKMKSAVLGVLQEQVAYG